MVIGIRYINGKGVTRVRFVKILDALASNDQDTDIRITLNATTIATRHVIKYLENNNLEYGKMRGIGIYLFLYILAISFPYLRTKIPS